MSDERVKKTGLRELAKEVVSFEPEIKKERRSHAPIPSNTYFQFLDTSRGFMLWNRRFGFMMRLLPGELEAAILELEAMTQKFNMDAISDGFDYTVRYNEYYFDAMQMDSLCLEIGRRLNHFFKNEKALAAAFGRDSKERTAYIDRLKKLSGMMEEMEKSARCFLDSLEKEFSLSDESLNRRSEAMALRKEDNE